MLKAGTLLTVIALVSCGGPSPDDMAPAGSAAAPPAADPWPTDGWATSAPEEQGMSATALSALDAEFAAGTHGYVDGMLVVRNGHLVFERTYRHDYEKLFETVADRIPGQYNYYDPAWHPYYRKGELHTMQSVSKSVTSALVGIAIGRGEIPGVSVEVLPYFSEFALRHPDDRWGQMTLEHVLTMTTGIAWDESTVAYTDPANSCAGMEKSQDWIQFVLDQPMADEPGSRFVYNSGATQLLSYVLQKATGQNAHDYAAEHLFRPLGITSHYWKRTPKGLADTEGGLYLTARDLAKFGYLYLKDGLWEGERLLPERGGRGRPRARWWTPDRGETAPDATATSGGCCRTATPRLPLSRMRRSATAASCSSSCPSTSSSACSRAGTSTTGPR